MRKVAASFGWNHEGLGHISRLIAIHTELSYRSIFFVEHPQKLIADYEYEQYTIPRFETSLLGDNWWNNDQTNSSNEILTQKIVETILYKQQGIIIHDVVIHKTLYNFGKENRWPQILILRDRKDILNPEDWVKTNFPDIKKVFHLGSQVKQTELLIPIKDIIRIPRDDKTIWNNDDENIYKIVITAGGGGHDDAQDFIQTAINVLQEFCQQHLNIKFSIKIITGPYYSQSIKISEYASNCCYEIISYINAFHSIYKDTHLLICQGGYNTVNEVINQSTKTIIVAAKRILDDQWNRIKNLANLSNNRILPCILDHKSILQACSQQFINNYSKNLSQVNHISGKEVITQNIQQLLNNDAVSND